MQKTTLEGLFSDPSFITILVVILLTVANILVGVSMLPHDNRKKYFKVHRLIFCFVVLFYGLFLWISHSQGNNEWFKFIVLAYFIVVIPITQKINITFHAILASLGLILLVGVVSFNVL
jgi:uncharacterized membrane protein